MFSKAVRLGTRQPAGKTNTKNWGYNWPGNPICYHWRQCGDKSVNDGLSDSRRECHNLLRSAPSSTATMARDAMAAIPARRHAEPASCASASCRAVDSPTNTLGATGRGVVPSSRGDRIVFRYRITEPAVLAGVEQQAGVVSCLRRTAFTSWLEACCWHWPDTCGYLSARGIIAGVGPWPSCSFHPPRSSLCVSTSGD